MSNQERWPVIVGVGEIVDRPDDPSAALEPLALMGQAMRRAEADAGAGVLASLDSLDIVHQVTWRYEGTAARLCERLGTAPRRAVYGITGGETPMRYLHEAALRIWRGESEVAAVCGAEAQHALAKAKSASVELPWTTPAAEVENRMRREDLLRPVAIRHGMMFPVQIYPLYENATVAAWGQTPAAAQAESAALYSRFAAVAAANEYAWSRKPYSAAQIATPAPDNRLIAFPYTKRMVANPAVNQGAAVMLMSAARARAMRIPEEKWIYLWGGAAANEPRDYLARDQYVRSDAQEAVLRASERIAAESTATLGATELYSCFPCVPKMARRTLGLSEDATPTVTGGLSLFGAPLNDYMTHATCAMVRTLRSGAADTGLLYGQGEYVTKHHAVVVSLRPPRVPLADSFSVQAEVDAKRGPVPPLIEGYTGSASVESHTVIYDRDGQPDFGTVLARTPEGHRLMARIPKNDASSLEVLTSPDRSPVGLRGQVSPLSEGMLRFGF